MSINPDLLRVLLRNHASGAISEDDVCVRLAEHLDNDGVVSSEELSLDIAREKRCGFPEVVYAPGKSVNAIVTAFEDLQRAGQSCLATRCSEDQAGALLKNFPEAHHNVRARTVSINQHRESVGRVPVVTAGTSDLPVAEEALETLKWMGVGTELIVDIGVAGPQRLLNEKHRFADADAIIVAAGMEGALPSVVGGWVSCPVIAVPTSVGYGAAFEGVAALLGMLNSCAANVAVVNIDAGFKAGYVAGMMARRSNL